uniref:DUF6534 domain-containing protein n=1 Tax=Moniliophthora roreri TaxID=221103 RepID=A0A0W0FNY0_MONRR
MSISQGFDLSEQLDVPFSGLLVSIALYGVTMAQAWSYFNQNRDKWPLRMLVLSLIIMDLTASVLEVIPYRYLLIVHFGNLLAVESEISIRYTMESSIITVIIGFAVQIFFASRIYIYLKEEDTVKRLHQVVPAVIVLCAIGSLACGLMIGIQGVMQPNFSLMLERRTKLELGLYCGLAALCDIFATIALIWTFWVSKTGFRKTDTMLYKLLQFTVTRGILITLVQVSFFATFMAYDPVELKWTASFFCESKVYVITMLAILNSRPLPRDNNPAISVSIQNTQNSIMSEQDSERPTVTNDPERGYVARSLNSTSAEQEGDESLPKPLVTGSNDWWATPTSDMVVKRET